MRGPAWTQEEDRRLAELYRGGALKEEIAAELGRSQIAIQGRLHAKKLLPPRPPITPDQVAVWKQLKEQGVSLKQAAQETGACPVTIRRHTGKWSNKIYRTWKAPEVKRVRELYQAGAPLKDIVAEVGRDMAQISTKVRDCARRNTRWTAEDSVALELLWNQGRARKEIALMLNKKECAVSFWRKKLGLPPRFLRRKP